MRAGYHRHAAFAWLVTPVDIWSMKCFVQVADRGSITHAADDLGITQPALTRRILQLETELGVGLLERRPRGIRLTGPGRELLEHARRILREVALAEAQVKRARSGQRGRVVLGTSPTLAPLLLPGCVARARTECPSVTLKVVETQPGMKGATASASYKPATLETGLQVMVPQFIEAGTRIKIDTRDDSYLERA